MKLFIAVMLITLTGCGIDVTKKEIKPISTSGLTSYFTDRNMTVEDFQNFQNNTAGKVDAGYVSGKEATSDTYFGAEGKVSATKHKAAGYTGDRNITGDAFSKQFDDYESRVKRKGEITKGYTSDRLDQIKDPDRKEREEIKALQNRADVVDGRLSSAESRIAAEEAKSAAQAILIDQMALATELRFLLAEGRIETTEDDVASLREEMLTSFDVMGDDLEDAVRDLKSYIDNENTEQDAELFIQLGEVAGEIADARLAAETFTNSQVSDAKDDLNDRISRVKRRLTRKINTKVRRLRSRVMRIKNRLLVKIDEAEQRANTYADVNDSDTQSIFDPGYLEDLIDDVELSVSDLTDVVGDAETAIIALQLESDLVCSVTTQSLKIVEIPAGHNLHGGWHNGNSHRVLRTITIPTVTCPSN